MSGEAQMVAHQKNKLKEEYSDVRAYQGNADISKIPKEYRAQKSTIVEMEYKGKRFSSTNSEGWERSSNKYFKQLDKQNPNLFSQQNKQRIYQEKLSPIIDDQFISNVPDYSKYKGETLIHHHVGGGDKPQHIQNLYIQVLEEFIIMRN